MPSVFPPGTKGLGGSGCREGWDPGTQEGRGRPLCLANWGPYNALQWRTSLRAARGKVSPSGLREEPDRDSLADTGFVSQTPVTLLAEAGMGSDGSANSLGTDGRFQSHPGLGSNAGSTACLPCDPGQGSSLSELQFSHLQNESSHSRGVLEVSVAGTQYTRSRMSGDKAVPARVERADPQ